MGFLSNILMHPEMLAAGAAAISIPILIHLLNRRRFKEVEWAAMEFLLDAEQKNRRRVRIEHLILLLLRCLAMLLIGALIARPFLPANLGAVFFDTQQYERIVVLDDSLSTRTLAGNRSGFEFAQEKLVELLEGLSSDETDDRVTLLLTSRPEEPVAAAKPITSANLAEWVDLVNELEPTDLAVDLGRVLTEVDRYLGEPRQDLNRIVYVMSDLMERDWRTTGATEDAALPHQILQGIADKVAGCFVVDMGLSASGNLAVESVRPAEAPVEGVPTRIDVRVRNLGTSEAQQVLVRLQIGDALPIEETIEAIPAGDVREIGFPVVFPRSPDDQFVATDDEGNALESRVRGNERSVRLTASASVDDVAIDALPADSVAYHSARVVRGVPVLIVDGDPNDDPFRSETLFLLRAIDPPGELSSGNLVDVVSYLDFDQKVLSDYRVIFLCNVDQLSPGGIAALESWVRDGGGLAILPGDRTRAARFDEQFYADGRGLSPFGLVDIQGDETREKWASFEVPETPHQVLRVFEGANNQLLDRVKLFNWWRSRVASPIPPDVNVLARLDDAEGSVAIAERAFGRGRVVSFVVPADLDWTNWPEEGLSFLLVGLDLTSYLSSREVGAGERTVGQQIAETVDLSLVRRQATLLDPTEERHDLIADEVTDESSASPAREAGSAAPTETAEAPSAATDSGEGTPTAQGTSTAAADPTRRRWQFRFAGTEHAGFYRLMLTGTDGAATERDYSINVDPSESRLVRLDVAEARRNLFGEKIRLVELDRLTSQAVEGGNREFWKWIVVVMIGILIGEQSLARWFRSRQ